MKVSVFEELQKGGYGALHRALSEDHVSMAVKKIPIEGQKGLPCLTEASIFSSFCHPALLKAHGVVVDSGNLNIILPLGDGDLLSWRDTNPTYDARMVKAWIYAVLEAIGQLHAQGLIHADIKAENVIRFRDSVKLTDFSLTRPIRKYRGLIATSTHRPPESWAGEEWNEKIDIWGLGCFIYQLVYGDSPFPDQDDSEAALNTIRIFLNHFLHPRHHLKLTSKSCQQPFFAEGMRQRSVINTVILTCLQWDPAKRPSAQQLLSHGYFVGMQRRAGTFISTPMVYIKEEAEIRAQLVKLGDNEADSEALRQFEENAYQLYNRTLRLKDIDSDTKVKTCAWMAAKLTRCPVKMKADFSIQVAEQKLCKHLNFRLHRPSLPPELQYVSRGSRRTSSSGRRN